MTEPRALKAGWVDTFLASPSDKDGLARNVEADDGRDDAENSYYKQAADPASSLRRQQDAGSTISTPACKAFG
jgi:hypothetical protein